METYRNRSAERCAEFVAKLQGLSRGEKARLKRNVGNTLAESHKVQDVYWRIRPYDLPPCQNEMYFMVATLFPFVAHSTGDSGFGRKLKGLVNDNNRKGFDRRFTALLDADEQQLPYRLRQLVMRFKAGDNRSINWAATLNDLTQWQHPDRYIQMRWARDYFTNDKNQSQTVPV